MAENKHGQPALPLDEIPINRWPLVFAVFAVLGVLFYFLRPILLPVNVNHDSLAILWTQKRTDYQSETEF